MNEDIIKKVIADQIEEIKFNQNRNLIIRDKMDYAMNFLDEKIIKVITGVRRCGKSTFCQQLLKDKNYLYLNFDDERLNNLKSEDLNIIFEKLLMNQPNPEFVFFDEIQNVLGWELFVNRLMRQGYNVILTGSNSKMLSKELATHLTGRHIQIELFPFSFGEFLKLKGYNFGNDKFKSTKQISELRQFYEMYLLSGGFPEISNIDFKKRYLKDLFEKIILRDIVERYQIREISSLRELSIYMLNNFSCLFSYNKLKNNLNFRSTNTVKDYLSYFEETYLFYYISEYSYKLKEQIRSPKKSYGIDTGLINSLQTSFSENTGRMMENLVFINEKMNDSEIYYLSERSFEVDFVIIREGKFKLIQVAKNIDNDKTYNREINALMKSTNHFPDAELILVTENDEREIGQIKVIPIWKYLLIK